MQWFGQIKQKKMCENCDQGTEELGKLEQDNRALRQEACHEQVQCCVCIEKIEKLSAENAVLKVQLAKAQKWYKAIQKQTPVLTCAYCGVEYPEGTTAGCSALYAHIRICDKHPMKKYIEFARYIDAHITDTCNAGHVWINTTPETIKKIYKELLKFNTGN